MSQNKTYVTLKYDNDANVARYIEWSWSFVKCEFNLVKEQTVSYTWLWFFKGSQELIVPREKIFVTGVSDHQ